MRISKLNIGSLGFNTQPPEGGCDRLLTDQQIQNMFQHTAARRRLPILAKLTF